MIKMAYKTKTETNSLKYIRYEKEIDDPSIPRTGKSCEKILEFRFKKKKEAQR